MLQQVSIDSTIYIVTYSHSIYCSLYDFAAQAFERRNRQYNHCMHDPFVMLCGHALVKANWPHNLQSSLHNGIH